MATPTRHVQDAPYGAVQYPELGSWNPTLNDSGPDTNECYVVKNLRMETPGQYTSRTGYNMFNTSAVTTVDGSSTVYFKSEYDAFDNSFDITYYYDPAAQAVSVILFNKTTQTVQVKLDIVTSLATAPENVEGIQYELLNLVTVFGQGLYAFFPKDAASITSTLASDWVILDVGKTLATTPWESAISDIVTMFAPTTTGDLIVRQSKNVPAANDYNQQLDYQPGQQEPPWLRLPIQANYWLVPDTAKFFDYKTKAWQWDKNDPSGYFDSTVYPTDSTVHVQERGWGYRAVYVQQYVNAQGRKITFRSQASVDWWVPNRNYSPAYIGYDTALDQFVHGQPVDWFATNGFGNWDDVPIDYPFRVRTGTTGITNDGTGIPTIDDLLNLQKAYRRYWHDEDYRDVGGTQDPFFFTACLLGWAIDHEVLYFGQTPYVIPVTAFDLKQAPMSLIKWTDFSTTDGTTANPNFPTDTTKGGVIKIEIYRTAYNGKDAQNDTLLNTDGSPLFQPNLYGYVGTIDADGTFTDDVKDTAIDFSKTPESYDGYLFGQFSGAVIRDYMDKIALGNIETHYWAFPPSNVQHSIGVQLLGHADLVAAASINSTYLFYYQYQDDEGNLSDMTEVKIDVSDGTGNISDIIFRVPYGYDPNITKVNVIMQDTGTSTYYLVTTITTLSGYEDVNIGSFLLALPSPYTTTTKDDKISDQPGAITYSEPNDMFNFPQINEEVIHKFAPITMMETITGPLWVWTDRSLTLTTISAIDPRTEEETKFVGNIGYTTGGHTGKANKIVYFLSAAGLYYAEASGVVPFPAKLQPLILEYLNETYAAHPKLTNAKRASIAYHGSRDELWVHFPSSADLGGSLPERTFIYRCWNGRPETVVNYEFEIVNPLDSTISAITKPVIFFGHSDGTFYSSYLEPSPSDPSLLAPVIFIMNNDVPAVTWPGPTYLEKRLVLGNPGKKKKLRTVSLRAGGLCEMWIVTGRPYYTGVAVPAHTPDYLGELYNDGTTAVNKYALAKNSATTNPQLLKHRTNGYTIETTAYIPAIRLVTQPDGSGNNSVTYYSLEAFLTIYDHP